MQDHPRSRGVYTYITIPVENLTGSSPLARGLLPPTYYVTHTIRIIPARAGFTRRSRMSVDSVLDHPRSRGVYLGVGVSAALGPGSSPLARGLPRCPPSVSPSLPGSSPLARGLPRCRRRHPAARQDHPRSRGVYKRSRSHTAQTPGSSPLARGLRYKPRSWMILMRIIPARAGFTR